MHDGFERQSKRDKSPAFASASRPGIHLDDRIRYDSYAIYYFHQFYDKRNVWWC